MVVSMNAPDRKASKLLRGATGEWEVVIGLEVHAQVTLQCQAVLGCVDDICGQPNNQVSLVDARCRVCCL